VVTPNFTPSSTWALRSKLDRRDWRYSEVFRNLGDQSFVFSGNGDDFAAELSLGGLGDEVNPSSKIRRSLETRSQPKSVHTHWLTNRYQGSGK